MGWLTGWLYRKPITLTGGSDGAQTDFQLKLSIAYATDHMQSDFDDLRFTKEDGETLIDTWLEDKTDGTSADIWVEFPTTPANGDTQTYYMYYGKSDAVSDWDIGETFLLGDEFSTYDTNKWQQAGNTTQPGVTADGYLDVQCDNQYFDGYASIDNFSLYGHAFTTYAKWYDTYGSEYGDGSGVHLSPDAPSTSSTYNPSRKLALIFRLKSDDSDAYRYYVEGSGTETGTSDMTNFHKLELRVDSSGNYEIIADGSTLASGSLSSDANVYVNHITNYLDVYHDYTFIRKYTANPPTYEFGSEQSESGGLSMAIVMHHLKQQRIS